MITHLGAFESTQMFGTDEDVLSTTRHLKLWREDLTLLHDAGIRELRYSVPWHRIEQREGEFDWRWMDGPMRHMQETGMQPIVDPLHHTSFPTWLTDGFLNPMFPLLYTRFLERFAERYEWIERYTVFNEPLPTTLFCSYTGMWYPHRASDRDFVAMVIQAGKAICSASALLKQKNASNQIVYIDTAESHRALDRKSVEWVRFANARRFAIHDLVLGKVDQDHAMYRYFAQHGLSLEDIAWFQEHAASIDVLGLDYYFHSEMEWFWNKEVGRTDIRGPVASPRGFGAVAMDYVKKFQVPILLSETNVRGTIFDRLSWLKLMEQECERLVLNGVDFRGFCWYPSIDSTDWSNCCTKCTRAVDPQGIWWLDEHRWRRHRSELSDAYSRLAQGKMMAKDLPAYEWEWPLNQQLRGFLRFTSDWKWVEQVAA